LKVLTRVAKGAVVGVRQQLSGARRARAVARHRQQLEADPENTTVLTMIANLHETGGDHTAAGECYRQLATIYRAKGDTDGIAFCYRKLDHLRQPYPARFYRELTNLYAKAGRYDRAGNTCRRVVDLYVDEGQHSAAVGYLRNMPEGDSLTKYANSELRRLLKGKGKRPTEAPGRTGPLGGELGNGALFEVARAAEADSFTGLLELESGDSYGAIYFSAGRIAAARFCGGLTGAEALKAVLALEYGSFTLAPATYSVEDEFDGRRSASVLSDLTRELKEAEAEPTGEFIFSY
jgi:tetratricopeptide (TPR) repeat protein